MKRVVKTTFILIILASVVQVFGMQKIATRFAPLRVAVAKRFAYLKPAKLSLRNIANNKSYKHRAELSFNGNSRVKINTSNNFGSSNKSSRNHNFKFRGYFQTLAVTGVALAIASDDKTKINDNLSKNEISPVLIEDGLYVGKVNDKFHLAMEKLTPENVEMWWRYACDQYRAMDLVDGIATFKEVIKTKRGVYNAKTNSLDHSDIPEVWIAYASSVPVSKKMNFENEDMPDKKAYSTIEMFVTITTCPDMPITYHAGISRTFEAQKKLFKNPELKQKDQSVHLHSFAAKVMKMKDQKKLYMLTHPVPAMRNILLKKMATNSMFIGDNYFKQGVLELNNDSSILEKYPTLLLHESECRQHKDETAEEYELRYREEAQKKLTETLKMLKSHPPCIKRETDKTITIQCSQLKVPIYFKSENANHRWLFGDAYLPNFLCPYVLVDLNKLARVTELN